MKRHSLALAALAGPATAMFAAFFLLPVAQLVLRSAEGGGAAYLAILLDARYRQSLLATLGLSAAVTLASLLLGAMTGLFLQRHRFRGRSLLVSLLTLPLAFPGVVVGFMIIMLGGRQGLVGQATQALGAGRAVFAYSMAGLFLGYLYFSLPRVITTVMAAAERMDPSLEEAARTLGAGPLRVALQVTLPALAPALVSTGALCFATSMGAFGTAFTLATQINVLPILIYTEFTLSANIGMAAALSVLLGAVTWCALLVARGVAGGEGMGAAV